ncbi:3-oxoacyl-[acyl-carrier-protein] synthase III C-terminal domain-containing protein, partial [uncultured Parasutterella sp.]
GKIVGDPYIRMEGRLVFKAAVEKMMESALNVLAAANLAPGDVDVYIPHQANLRIMNMVRGKLNIPESNLVVSVTKHGNTSAASVPLALDKARQSGQLKRGDIVLLQGVGGGFTWASALLKF